MCTAQFERLKVQGSSRLHINKKITLNIIQLGAQKNVPTSEKDNAPLGYIFQYPWLFFI